MKRIFGIWAERTMRLVYGDPYRYAWPFQVYHCAYCRCSLFYRPPVIKHSCKQRDAVLDALISRHSDGDDLRIESWGKMSKSGNTNSSPKPEHQQEIRRKIAQYGKGALIRRNPWLKHEDWFRTQ